MGGVGSRLNRHFTMMNRYSAVSSSAWPALNLLLSRHQSVHQPAMRLTYDRPAKNLNRINTVESGFFQPANIRERSNINKFTDKDINTFSQNRWQHHPPEKDEPGNSKPSSLSVSTGVSGGWIEEPETTDYSNKVTQTDKISAREIGINRQPDTERAVAPSMAVPTSIKGEAMSENQDIGTGRPLGEIYTKIAAPNLLKPSPGFDYSGISYGDIQRETVYPPIHYSENGKINKPQTLPVRRSGKRQEKSLVIGRKRLSQKTGRIETPRLPDTKRNTAGTGLEVPGQKPDLHVLRKAGRVEQGKRTADQSSPVPFLHPETSSVEAAGRSQDGQPLNPFSGPTIQPLVMDSGASYPAVPLIQRREELHKKSPGSTGSLQSFLANQPGLARLPETKLQREMQSRPMLKGRSPITAVDGQRSITQSQPLRLIVTRALPRCLM